LTTHHPSDATLLAYATGTLPEALALVVATHLVQCPHCAGSLATLEAGGGILLANLPPTAMEAGVPDQATLDRRMPLQGVPASMAAPSDIPLSAPPPILHPDLPPPLNRVAMGRWWPIGIGIRWRMLRVRGSAWGGLILAQPGRSFPRHGHTGLELTCVLSGSFVDAEDEYSAGDLAEPTGDHDQPPIATGSKPCFCVLSTEGMRMRGMAGLAQRLIGV